MEAKFIKADHEFLHEIAGYTSIVDYNQEFSQLTDDILKDLKEEVDYYFNLFVNGNLPTAIIDTTNKSISSIHFDIDLYIYEISSTHSRIGFQVFMKETSLILQHLSYTAPFNKAFNLYPQQMDTFKEYLLNCLFYIFIFCRKFRYHPMLTFFHHVDDIKTMADIKLRRHRLFGDEETECSVCFESTITLTTCNHSLCHSCYSKLRVKVCPLCRGTLESQYFITMDYGAQAPPPTE